MNKNKWNLINKDGTASEAVKALAKEAGIPEITALLLMNRGFSSAESARRFIELSDSEFHSPFLIPDMEKAVERIERAIAEKEKVVIYGDYDVDGVTSVSVLYLYLKSRGLVVGYYIPDRSGEGYGINNSAIEKFAAEKVTLMITVDTGVTATEEVAFAKSFGIDTVVTDHHECQEQLPEAVAVINPRRADSSYPFKELAGVGVVFKLLSALEEKRNEENKRESNFLGKLCDEYIDLVAMGTIADVMPLVDENRLLVSRGLDIMSKRPRKGITALLAASSRGEKTKAITASSISFVIAPRINAAGRIDNAERAVGLFLSNSDELAEKTAVELCEINRARQAEENRIIESAEEKIAKEFDFENDKIIVLADDGWHHGVIGIVASRITERFGLPSILISFDGDVGKGSGRSIKGINLVDALTDSADLLVKFGGHELAAGLSVERDKLPEFRKKINEYVKKHLEDAEKVSGIDVDSRLMASEITVKSAEDTALLEPYGIANPTPLFEVDSLVIRSIMQLGEKHTKMIVEGDGVRLTALKFGKSRSELEFYAGDRVDMLFNLNINDFRGERTAQLIVKEMRLSEGQYAIKQSDREKYLRVMSGDTFSREDDLLPTRDDLGAVYIYLKRRFGNIRDDITGIREILEKNPRINYTKLRIILNILEESGVINTEYYGENSENMKYTVNYVKNKVDTEKAPTYVRLKAQMKK